MPRKPSRPCRYPGCPNFCEPGAVYCPEHMKDGSVNLREKWRGSAASRGYDSRWRRARMAFLQAHPLCAECMADTIRQAMYAADFYLVEETDRGYNQPAYETATRTYTVFWTWVCYDEVM